MSQTEEVFLANEFGTFPDIRAVTQRAHENLSFCVVPFADCSDGVVLSE